MMKIIRIGEPQVIMINPYSRHNYFGWPTVARLQNGTIAVAASGYRLRHVCPFGKTVLAFSYDEGGTYTTPAPVIDTVLDDRDGGLAAFGEKSVIITSFNNTVNFQRSHVKEYGNAYLDMITPEEEAGALGVTFRFSHDYGVTWGSIYKSPVTSPHGPLELKDGSLLWIGRVFSAEDRKQPGVDCIKAYKVNLDGTTEYVGQIENIEWNGIEPLSCEPHSILLEDGRILTHIRVQHYGEKKLFTIYQSVSIDEGRTWSKPKPVLSELGGAPPHIMKHSSGVLICTYGYREKPYGIRAMFSYDNGETWDVDHDLYINGVNGDLGYPSTVELNDGSLITVFYGHLSEEEPAVILQQKWRME